MRQIVLDTETTGLESELDHRIIEIGCVELVNRRLSGRSFHRYLNPDRDIEAAAQAVHGITREALAREPRFVDIADEFLAFIGDAELVIHNAAFDVGFLDAELARAPGPARTIATFARVLDTLALARRMHPGQRNNLDALCKRYGVDNANRELHGALLDARLLADVYLAMTGGQATLALDERGVATQAGSAGAAIRAPLRAGAPLIIIAATPAELVAHDALLALVAKTSGRCLWRAGDVAPDASGDSHTVFSA
ncbi:MAG TPA: DNA polymerase III subunit epsilon [Steroidobacteraceae bacterium]